MRSLNSQHAEPDPPHLLEKFTNQTSISFLKACLWFSWVVPRDHIQPRPFDMARFVRRNFCASLSLPPASRTLSAEFSTDLRMPTSPCHSPLKTLPNPPAPRQFSSVLSYSTSKLVICHGRTCRVDPEDTPWSALTARRMNRSDGWFSWIFVGLVWTCWKPLNFRRWIVVT